MSGIALNFFPLATDEFKITFYRLPYVEDERPTIGDETAVYRHLEINGSRELYWTLFQRPEDGVEEVYEPSDDVYLTKDAIRYALIQSCTQKLSPDQFTVVGGFRKRVEILIAEYDEGNQVVSLEPYLLRSRRKFGFLANFRFHPTEEYIGTRRALELSLSLDKKGQRNLNYYGDRYSQLTKYVKEFHNRIFPLLMPGGQKLAVKPKLLTLSPETLRAKKYLVGSGREARSQFFGINQNGPLKQPDSNHLYFLYMEEDRPFAHDLFRALRGDTFHHTFPGMETVFRVAISGKNVSGASLSDFNSSEILRIRDKVVEDAVGKAVVPIVLTPFSKHDAPEENAEYWKLKHAFLSKKLPIQVVATETVADKEKLKWSAASIGLQIFAKLGGTPWKVKPRTERCLIVGIGQAHEVGDKGIERFFAYSVLTDSSGIFEEVRVLADAQEQNDYIHKFSDNLRKIFAAYSSRFSSFVVHSTFKIRRTELQSIEHALREQQTRQVQPGEFVSVKFNDKNKFFGFAVDHNSLVPYESTIISLSRNEFLVWFEGMQHGRSTLSKMVGGPLHMEFKYPTEGLSFDQKKAFLQDAINLSGANWRGFNAKSLPVSVYYAQLIAKYLKEFENHGLPSVDVGILKPWFL